MLKNPINLISEASELIYDDIVPNFPFETSMQLHYPTQPNKIFQSYECKGQTIDRYSENKWIRDRCVSEPR
jgi:hypothetical protein